MDYATPFESSFLLLGHALHGGFHGYSPILMPFLQKDNYKSSSNYQILKKKFEALKQKWREKEVNDDVYKHEVFLVDRI